jgi:hypothetical protein
MVPKFANIIVQLLMLPQNFPNFAKQKPSHYLNSQAHMFNAWQPSPTVTVFAPLSFPKIEQRLQEEVNS